MPFSLFSFFAFVVLALLSAALPLATNRSPSRLLRGKIGWLLSAALCALGIALLMVQFLAAEATAVAAVVLMAGIPAASFAIGWSHHKAGSRAR